MPEQITVIDVIVPAAPVVDVAAIGVQGPPGADGAPGPPGPVGPQGPAGTAGLHAATHYVGGADALAGSLAATDVRVGTNPAQSGAVRLANDTSIKARNGANSADIELMKVDVNGTVLLGAVNTNGFIIGRPSDVLYLPGTVSGYGNNPLQGFASMTVGAGANTAMFYVDKPATKCRLMVQFPTGAPVQIAIEP